LYDFVMPQGSEHGVI